MTPILSWNGDVSLLFLVAWISFGDLQLYHENRFNLRWYGWYFANMQTYGHIGRDGLLIRAEFDDIHIHQDLILEDKQIRVGWLII